MKTARKSKKTPARKRPAETKTPRLTDPAALAQLVLDWLARPDSERAVIRPDSGRQRRAG